jgi:transmembrane sensor
MLGGGGLFALVNRHAHAETKVGERQSLSLSNGARLDVNTDSKVSWHAGKETTEVWLDRGEIALAVPAAKGAFIIHVLNHRIEPLEGQVNVRIHAGGLEVTCLKGETMIIVPRPKLKPHEVVEEAAPITVKSGQAFYSVSRTYGAKILNDTDIESVEAWQSDEMLFTGQTLTAVVEEYNRYLTRKIVIRDPALANLRLGGRFNVHDTAAFLQGLKSAFGISANVSGREIELTR